MKLQRLNPQQFDRFSDFIYKKSGIRIDEKKVSLLSNRIRRRLRAGDFKDFDVYYQFLTSSAGASELDGFLDAVTTNETFFFRSEKHFDWLRTELLTELLAAQQAGKRSRSLRIWSAGCATGAEPYSMAICLVENGYRLREWSLAVLGTDISEEALQAAREGQFKAQAIGAVTEAQRRRFFKPQAQDRWQVRPQVKELVEFKRHNLMERIREPAFDCIFIRNVLIYFDRISKQVVVNNLLRALAVGGYLVIGPSEGIHDLLGSLQRISPYLYRKVDGKSSHLPEGVRGGVQP